MTDTTVIDVERARAERKSPVLLWVLNILWPGLGNLVVGQILAGLVFGFVHLFLVGGMGLLSLLTGPFGLLPIVPGGFLCFINWIAASAVGHQWINQRYLRALEAIEAKRSAAAGGRT
jgi:hypothetical protein